MILLENLKALPPSAPPPPSIRSFAGLTCRKWMAHTNTKNLSFEQNSQILGSHWGFQIQKLKNSASRCEIMPESRSKTPTKQWVLNWGIKTEFMNSNHNSTNPHVILRIQKKKASNSRTLSHWVIQHHVHNGPSTKILIHQTLLKRERRRGRNWR